MVTAVEVIEFYSSPYFTISFFLQNFSVGSTQQTNSAVNHHPRVRDEVIMQIKNLVLSVSGSIIVLYGADGGDTVGVGAAMLQT